jgi:hypothetical protein
LDLEASTAADRLIWHGDDGSLAESLDRSIAGQVELLDFDSIESEMF